MIVGIMSDTHDHLDNIRKALEVFEQRGVQHLIHAGDFTSPFTWRVLKDFKGGITAIFGNNDGDKILLRNMYQDHLHAQPHLFTLKGRRIVMVHEPDVVDALAESGKFDLVIYGHTHEPVIQRVKDAWIINPGEVCGWLYGKPTVAVIDLKTMQAEIVKL